MQAEALPCPLESIGTVSAHLALLPSLQSEGVHVAVCIGGLRGYTAPCSTPSVVEALHSPLTALLLLSAALRPCPQIEHQPDRTVRLQGRLGEKPPKEGAEVRSGGGPAM